jgi:hypothetical protein
MNVSHCMKEELESRNAAACNELRQKYGKEVEEAIKLVKTTGDRQTVLARGGAIAFADLAPPAFANPAGGIAWGIISDGSNLWHGVRLPDGKDVLEEALSLDPAGLSCK